MWVFTKYGFYSAVAALRKGKVDPTRVVVRARVREHLEELSGFIEENLDLPALKITSNGMSDYRYRVVLGKAVWEEICEALARDIDYSNFKGACGHGEYHDALMKVWNVMYGMQSKRTPLEREVDDRLDREWRNLFSND
jgi:hypothetical protein